MDFSRDLDLCIIGHKYENLSLIICASCGNSELISSMIHFLAFFTIHLEVSESELEASLKYDLKLTQELAHLNEHCISIQTSGAISLTVPGKCCGKHWLQGTKMQRFFLYFILGGSGLTYAS